MISRRLLTARILRASPQQGLASWLRNRPELPEKRRSAHVRNCEIRVGTRDRRASRAYLRAKRLRIRSPRPSGSLSKTHLKRTAPLSHGPPPYAAYVHKGLTAAQRSCCEMRAQPRDKTHTMHVTHHSSFDLARYPRIHDHIHALDYSDAPSNACVRGPRMSDRSAALLRISDAPHRPRRLTYHQHEAQSRPARHHRAADGSERRGQMASNERVAT